MAKRKKTEEEKGADVGATMTVSLFLILLTFFILLNSIAVLDDRKVRKAMGSLTGSFGSFPGGLSALNTGESIMPESSPMISPKVDLQQLLLSLDEQILSHVKIDKGNDRDTVVIEESDLFHENSHTLKNTSLPLLNKMALYMQNGNYMVEICGHTDDQSGKEKGYRSNWELSSLMAIEVLKYLIEKGQIAPERLSAYGRGGLSPNGSNDTRQSRAKNRRVEIIFKYKTPAYTKRIFSSRHKGIFTYKRFNFKVF